MEKYKSLKSGVSLIVFVVTIVVLLILVSVTILSLKDDDVVSKAKEAVFKEDILNFQTELKSYIDDKKFEAISLGQYYSPENDTELLEVRDYNSIKKIIPSFYNTYENVFIIKNGDLFYDGSNTDKSVTDVLDELNVKYY